MKRFTETTKWDDPWFLDLPLELKALWMWLCDRCDNAGIVEPSLRLASFQIGYEYPSNTLSRFGDRLVEIDGGKWFLPKFIPFQYGSLSEDCKAHRPVFQSLQKHFPKGYPMGINTLKEKEKETVKEKDQEKEEDRTNRKRYATHAEVASYASSVPMGISPECVDAFFDKMESIGWLDDNGLPLADWRARFRRYATNWANNANSPNRKQS